MGNFKFFTMFALAFLFSVMGFAQESKELLINGNFESGAAKWKAYCDAAGTSPVDGVGGGGSGLTISASTTSPIAGKSSGVITKDAANRQGCGVAADFTIDNEFKAKVLQIKLTYQVTSGTYADDQFKVYIYDVTNSTMIESAPTFVKNATGIEEFRAIFQTSATGSSYRLIIHNSTTSASAATMKIEASVSSKTLALGTFATDWVQYTPTTAGFGTVGHFCFSRRVADSLEARCVITTGTPDGTQARISLGYNGISGNVTVDSNKSGSGYYDNVAIGSAWTQNASSTYFMPVPKVSGDKTGINFGAHTSTTSPTTLLAGNVIQPNGGSIVTFDVKVPIVGWTANTTLSSETDTRVVAARYTMGGASTIGNATNTDIIYPNKEYDTHNAYNTSNGVYTVPVSGKYRISGNIEFASSGVGHREFYVDSSVGPQPRFMYRGGNATVLDIGGGTTQLDFKAGETFKLRVYQDSGGNLNVGTNGAPFNYFEVERISGPTQIAASETVAFKAQGSPTCADFTSFDTTAIFSSLGTYGHDTHGGFNTSTGVYTVPVSGLYDIQFHTEIAGTSVGAGYQGNAIIKLNGSTTLFNSLTRWGVSETTSRFITVSGKTKLKAGDTLRPVSGFNVNSGTSFAGGQENHWFEVTRVGN